MFSARTLTAVSFAAMAAQVAYGATCTRKYTVKAGDYCDKISAANNVSTYQLGVLNAGVINEACDNLVIGQELCIGSEGEDCSTTYIVNAGNTCSQIWDAVKVNSTIFSFNNPQVNQDCTNIYVGEVLCVANEVLVPPSASVPIHTGPPATATSTATPTAKPASEVAKPTTTPPAATTTPAAAATTKAPAQVADDDEEEEECEEIEVVVGGDEDLPFCDELD